MRRLLTVTATAVALTAALPSAAGALVAGDLDPGFASGGVSARSLGAGGDVGTSVAIQSDGKILFGGFSYNEGTDGLDPIVGRLNADGSIDSGYGVAGIARLSLSAIAFGNALAVQPDGKAVLAGYRNGTPNESIVARFTTAGALDTASFAAPAGYRTQAWSGAGSEANAVSVLPNGSILAAGSTANSPRDFAFGRFTADGTNDGPFGGGANSFFTSAQSAGGDDAAYGLASYGDGSFIAAGTVSPALDSSLFAVARYKSDGTPDPTFAGDGSTTVSIDAKALAQDLAIQPDQKIVVAGMTEVATPVYKTALARLNSDGTPDGTFGIGGRTAVQLTGSDRIHGVAIQADGKIVVAGSGNDDKALLVARFNANGTPDAGFGSGGKVVIDPTANNDGANDVALQSDGKIVVAGSVNPTGAVQADDLAIARLIGVSDPVPVPASRITSPKKSKTSRRKARRIAGTAAPASVLTRVEVAIRRVDGRRLKKHNRCVWIKNTSGKTRLVKARKKKCNRQVWLRASGKTKWHFKLKKSLPAGSYYIYSRATLATGARESVFTTRAKNLKKIKLTR